jgi:protocatechuate 3,4-dioxygenase beta subunit
MSKKIQLSIPKPCHEDWNVMTPVEKGKFCGSCQKQVVDFSNMSDRDIAQFFKKPSTGSVCGRFMTDQLDRSIEIPKKRIPWLKYFFQVLLPAFFISKVSAQKIMTSSKIVTKDTTRTPMNGEFRTLGMVLPTCIKPANDSLPPIKMTGTVSPIEVKGERGKVLDAETGKPLEGAKIIMFSTIGKDSYKSDKNGAFILNTVRKITVNTIEISYPGYETTTLTFSQFMASGSGKHIVSLKKRDMIMGDYTVLPMNNIKGEVAVKPVKDTMPPACNEIMGKIVMPVPTERTGIITLKGRVTDEKGEPLAFASIMIKGTKNGVMANANGEFSIKPGSLLENFTLTASSVGFETKEIEIEKNKIGGAVTLQLNSIREAVMTGFVICTRPPVKKEIKKVPLMPAVVRETPNQLFKVFPNPVSSGTGLTIEWNQRTEGYFTLQLLNQAGQQAYQQELWIDAEARLLSIDIPTVAPGTYFIVFTNKKSGKKFSDKIVVQ